MTHLAPLLLAVLGALILACIAGLVAHGGRQRGERMRRRIAAVSEAPVRRVETVTIARAAPARKGLLPRLAAMFGFHPARCGHHLAPWWAVLGVAMLGARGLVFMLEGIVGDPGWVLLPIAWVVISRAIFGRWDRKRRLTLLNQLPDALSMIVRAVRVGLPVNEAIRSISLKSPMPTSGEFARVSSEVAVGTGIADALQTLAERTGVQEYRLFATALALQAQTGGALTETLENLADLVRKRIALRARGYALSSEARTSSLVLSAMPFVTALALYFVSPHYIAPMFTEVLGQEMLGLALALLIVGTFIMRTIIRKTLA